MTDYSRMNEYGLTEKLNVLSANLESALSGAEVGIDDFERREIVKAVNELIVAHIARSFGESA